jgi:hypothetical protein
MRSVTVALALSLAGPVAHAQQASAARACDADEARRRICAVDDSLRSALLRADTTLLSRLYADDLLTTNYRGVRSTKEGLLRSIGGDALRFDTLVVHQRTAELHGDTAIVAARMHQVARGRRALIRSRWSICAPTYDAAAAGNSSGRRSAPRRGGLTTSCWCRRRASLRWHSSLQPCASAAALGRYSDTKHPPAAEPGMTADPARVAFNAEGATGLPGRTAVPRPAGSGAAVRARSQR